jgi:hypothetical protein
MAATRLGWAVAFAFGFVAVAATAGAQDDAVVGRLTRYGKLSAGQANRLTRGISKQMARSAGLANQPQDPLRMAVSRALFGQAAPSDRMGEANVRLRLYAGLNEWALETLFPPRPGVVMACQRDFGASRGDCEALVAAAGRVALSDAQQLGGGDASAFAGAAPMPAAQSGGYGSQGGAQPNRFRQYDSGSQGGAQGGAYASAGYGQQPSRFGGGAAGGAYGQPQRAYGQQPSRFGGGAAGGAYGQQPSRFGGGAAGGAYGQQPSRFGGGATGGAYGQQQPSRFGGGATGTYGQRPASGGYAAPASTYRPAPAAQPSRFGAASQARPAASPVVAAPIAAPRPMVATNTKAEYQARRQAYLERQKREMEERKAKTMAGSAAGRPKPDVPEAAPAAKAAPAAAAAKPAESAKAAPAAEVDADFTTEPAPEEAPAEAPASAKKPQLDGDFLDGLLDDPLGKKK